MTSAAEAIGWVGFGIILGMVILVVVGWALLARWTGKWW